MGWSRANLIYDKMKKLPAFGSLLEAMCLMIQRHRHGATVLSARAQAQAAIGGDKATGAFKDFVDHLSRVEREDETKVMRERIEKLKSIKEIRFKPMNTRVSRRHVPVISADEVRAQGRLDRQVTPIPGTRPSRARKKRETR